MKCKNCKADNKMKSICDAGIACYVLRCGEYGCALNDKTVNKLLRMKAESIDVCKKTNGDRIRAMTNEELAEFLTTKHCVHKAPHCKETDCTQCWLDWLRGEADNGK